MHWLLIIIFLAGLNAFSTEGDKQKDSYFPVFFLRGEQNQHNLVYYDIKQESMTLYKAVRFGLEDCSRYAISISRDGKLLAVHCNPIQSWTFINMEQGSNSDNVKIINLNTGEIQELPLKKNIYVNGSGVFTRNYYAFPCHYLAPEDERMKKYEEMKKNGEISQYFMKSEFNTSLGDGAGILILNLNTNKKKIKKLPDPSFPYKPREIGIYGDGELEDYIYALTTEPYILNIDEGKWLEYGNEDEKEQLFFDTDQVFKYQNSNEKTIFGFSGGNFGQIVGVDPACRKVLYYRGNNYSRLYMRDLKSKEATKINAIYEGSDVNLLKFDTNPDRRRYQFIGWVNKESIK